MFIRGNKRPTRYNRLVFIAERIVRTTCFGHHYAHHQELMIYTDGCCLWFLALWFTGRWSGVELRVMCSGLQDAAEQHHANRST